MNSKGLSRVVTAAVTVGLLGIVSLGQGCNNKTANPSGLTDTTEMRVAFAAREDAYYHGAGRMDRSVQVRATGEEHRNLCYVTPINEGWVWPELNHVDPSEGDDEVRSVRAVMDKIRAKLPTEARVLSAYGFKRACLIVATTDGGQITGGGIGLVFLVTPPKMIEITKPYIEQHGSTTGAVEALMGGEPEQGR
jgi:hypothetical protein